MHQWDVLQLQDPAHDVPSGWNRGSVRGVLDPQEDPTPHLPARVHAVRHHTDGRVCPHALIACVRPAWVASICNAW